MSSTAKPADPVYMLNALWFEPAGGAERYAEYVRAATPLLAARGARVVEPAWAPDRVLEAEGVEAFDPDLCFVVEWPSWEVFLSLLGDPEYVAIKPLREEATRKRLLVRCRRAPSAAD